MNVKQITRALHTLSLLSDEDYDLVLKLRALTEDERGQFRTALELQKPAGKKATTERKIEHCVACDYTKRALVHKDPNADGYHEFQSAKGEKRSSKPSQSSTKSSRAARIEQQLSKRRGQGRAGTTKDDDESDNGYGIVLCGASLASSGANCNLPEGHALHADKGYVDYHPFQPAASSVPTRSPANGGVESTTQNSEVSAVSAQAATGGSGE